jgi:hypothetical protein
MKDVTHYNNYYEFSTKRGACRPREKFQDASRAVTIDGAVKKKQVLDIDSILSSPLPRTHLPPPLRRRLVNCGALGWVPRSVN